MDRNNDVKTSFSKIIFLRRHGVAIFADIIKIVTIFFKTILKDSRLKLKELEIMYQNGISICISCHSKIC